MAAVPLRILHVIGSLDPASGGPPSVVWRLSAAQAALGHSVTVIGPRDPARDAVIVDNSHESPTVTAEFMLAHFQSRQQRLGL